MRKATRIELHDVPMILNVENDVAGWHDTEESGAIYQIDGQGVYNLLDALLRQPRDLMDFRSHKDHYPLLRKITPVAGEDESEDYVITEILAKTKINAVDIEFIRIWRNQDTPYEEKQSITYSGSYTIWWTKE